MGKVGLMDILQLCMNLLSNEKDKEQSDKKTK